MVYLISTSLIVFLHGIIHLLGFLSSIDLLKSKEFKEKVDLPWGIAWLFGAILMFIYAFLLLLEWDYSLFIGLTAIAHSQFLIVVFWKTAKWGTIFNVLILMDIIRSLFAS